MSRFFWTPALIDRAKRLREAGLTIAAVAAELDCTNTSVIRAMKPFGLNNRRKMLARAAKTAPYKAWTKAEFDRLKAMRAAGRSYDDIAVALNRTGQSVRSKNRDDEFVPPKSSGVSTGGWPSVGFDLQANDDKYVSMLLKAAKLEGCYGPTTARAA